MNERLLVCHLDKGLEHDGNIAIFLLINMARFNGLVSMIPEHEKKMKAPR
jgi:hypothetical protein